MIAAAPQLESTPLTEPTSPPEPSPPPEPTPSPKPTPPVVSSPIVDVADVPQSTSRIGNTVKRLEKDLSVNDLEAAEYIDKAMLKHIEAVLPK